MGKVTLVGAGPGDPGLLTVKGRQAILDAEVVVYDRLVGPEILALMPYHAQACYAALHRVVLKVYLKVRKDTAMIL